MKIWKLLIPLLISTNLVIGMPTLNVNETWEIEKRQEPENILRLDMFNASFTGNLKKAFYGNDQFNNFVNGDYQCNNVTSIKAILKNNNLADFQKFWLLDYFESTLNNFKFNENATVEVGGKYFPCIEVIEKRMTDYEFFQSYIRDRFWYLSDIIRLNINFEDDRANATMKYFKKSSFEFLRDLKKSYKKLKIKRPLNPDQGRNNG